ncbi:Mov34/MPN/PAD-1 family protein [Pseudoxanthomonas sp. PXM02]|uniref:Mov34/MPN/PAD-1 family protein n=1 Tax=Pseudoxanthomonas sp. PXM02 TaxID=2769294 RepID=UPI00177E023D|nr:Mov34/MPN/PAD-1 family protein [Pseudoxanthomonas sp. PXM02]
MKIFVPEALCEQLSRELKLAGRREIGGVLVAEYLGDGTFNLMDASVQRHGGTQMTFERDPEQHRQFLADFYQRTGHDYARFNYLGEWHSHPTVAALPSYRDISSMQEIVSDPAVNAPFAVLMIARRRFWRGLELSATVFRPAELPCPALLFPLQPSNGGHAFEQLQSRRDHLR